MKSFLNGIWFSLGMLVVEIAVRKAKKKFDNTMPKTTSICRCDICEAVRVNPVNGNGAVPGNLTTEGE